MSRAYHPMAARWNGSIALVGVLLLQGCTVGPDYVAPSPPALDRITARTLPSVTSSTASVGGAPQRLVPGRDVEGDWWELLHSPRIDELVALALRNSPTLAAAQATLRQARENTRAEEGSLLPSLTASANVTREREEGSNFLTLHSGSLDVSYAFDVFGGVRRQVEALGAQAEYERFELEAADLSLTANVVTAALNEASYQAQIDATQEIIRVDQRQLDVLRRRFDLGGVSKADVLLQQTTLDTAVATLPPLRKALEQQHDQLAAYLGLAPSQLPGPTVDLASLTLPARLPSAVPSQVVAQRPDVQAYAALLHVASANVGVAVANMLPQISLTGSYGRVGSSIANALTPGGIAWTVAGGLAQPVFEGGTLLARRKAADAALDAAIANYDATVASAFQDVSNALVAVLRDAETLKADVASERTAAASLTVTQAQFQAGGTPYVTVLQAEQTYQGARLRLVAAQAARFTDSVALFQSLGGGWWHRADVAPSVSRCCGIIP